MQFLVKEINGDDITVDFNHPLAGKTLHFNLELLNLRDATQEELDHGHVHGAGGHHH
jgi:FKBP-type peptidyl-prolyl cis-trans isomerase SlyD